VKRPAAGLACSGIAIALVTLGGCIELPEQATPPAPTGGSGGGGGGPAAARPDAGRADVPPRRDGPARADAGQRRDAPGRIDAGARRDAGGPDGPINPFGAPCNTADYVPSNILLPRCGSCHNTGPGNITNFIVTTPGVRSRLSFPSATCVGKVLLISTEPDVGGYLIDKLTGAPGICGNRMPAVGPALPPDQIECVKTWLKSTR
jgi:hypothetical protein